MRISYNVTGEERKRLVGVIAEATGASPAYKFMPTCAYEVGRFTVSREGALEFDDRADTGEAEAVLAALAAAGFKGVRETEEAAGDGGQTGLTVSLPKDGFTDAAIGNLRKLAASKAGLIRKALDADRLDIQTEGDKVSFPWWDTLPGPEEARAYTAFIAALCKMAKEAKRVTATEKEVESEKYAFRGFLLRLGFIGADSKNQRKLLLRNLSGSAAFRTEAEREKWKGKHCTRRGVKGAGEEGPARKGVRDDG